MTAQPPGDPKIDPGSLRGQEGRETGSAASGPSPASQSRPTTGPDTAAPSSYAGSTQGESSPILSDLQELLSSDNWLARLSAIDLLGNRNRLGQPSDEDVISLLVKALEDPHPAVRCASAIRLGECKEQAELAASYLLHALQDPDETVRRAAVHGVSILGASAPDLASAVLKASQGDPSEAVRKAAETALQLLRTRPPHATSAADLTRRERPANIRAPMPEGETIPASQSEPPSRVTSESPTSAAVTARADSLRQELAAHLRRTLGPPSAKTQDTTTVPPPHETHDDQSDLELALVRLWEDAHRDGSLRDPVHRKIVEDTWRELKGLQLSGTPFKAAARAFHARCRSNPRLLSAESLQAPDGQGFERIEAMLLLVAQALESRLEAGLGEQPQRFTISWNPPTTPGRGLDARVTREGGSTDDSFSSLRALARTCLASSGSLPTSESDAITDQFLEDLRAGRLDLRGFRRLPLSTDQVTFLEWSPATVKPAPAELLPPEPPTRATSSPPHALSGIAEREPRLLFLADSAFESALMEDSANYGKTPTQHAPNQSDFPLTASLLALLRDYTQEPADRILAFLIYRFRRRLSNLPDPQIRQRYMAALEALYHCLP
jgi:HEAT repeats